MFFCLFKNTKISYWHAFLSNQHLSDPKFPSLCLCYIKRFLNQQEFFGPPHWSPGCRPGSVKSDWIEIYIYNFFLRGGDILMKGWLIWCQAFRDGLNCVCRRGGPGQSWLLLPFPPATAAAALRKFDFHSSETHGSPFLSTVWLPFSLRVHKWFFIGWNLHWIG